MSGKRNRRGKMKKLMGGVWIGRIANGKIVEAREDGDALGWMQQLGMELRPKEAKKK
jgi:hypothetical protein